MKTLKYILYFLAISAVFSACEQEEETPKVATYDTPVILTPSDGASYVLTEATQDNYIEALEWTGADYGFQAAVTYTLEMDASGGDFSAPVEVATSTSTKLRLTVKQLNDAAIGFVDPETQGEVSLRLKATVHDEVKTLFSDPVAVLVTPYLSIKTVQPLYIVGNVLGDKEWDVSNYEYVMFHAGDPSVFEYTYTGSFAAGGFKLIGLLGGWDEQYGLSGGALVANDGGSSDLKIDANGYYTVTINTDELTYAIEPYDAAGASTYMTIGLIGEFNEWGADLALTATAYDPHIWIADNVELPDGEVKFRANGAWDVNWGNPDAFPFGQGLSGGDNIKATAGTYFVKFNDLTGHYVFLKKE